MNILFFNSNAGQYILLQIKFIHSTHFLRPQYCFDEPVFGLIPILTCLFDFLTVTEEYRAFSITFND